ncbi:MAG TPA: hypothetical protein VHW23_48305 [Kofleriaceae bacterium]|nr:hypothetical protein [Kofleriaceae bacterium]
MTASFALEAGGVRATCPACHHAMAVPVAPAAADAPACPKCGAPRGDDAAACPDGGLGASRMASYRDARDAAVPEPVHAAWQRAAEAWSDPTRHDELLQQVAAHSCYAWAAARYRARRRDPVAERQLDRLRRAAEATLLAGATVRPDTTAGPYRATLGVLAILIAAIVIGVVYATLIRGPSGAVDPAGPSAPVPVQPLTPGHPVSPSTVR